MRNIEYIVIGGSAGSFQLVTKILDALPKQTSLSIILALHRLRHIKSGFSEALKSRSAIALSEPYDKEKILPGKIYSAPANYHLYIQPDKTFALSSEAPVNHSRPSIDLTFSSAAFSLREKVAGIILSGANADGAEGLRDIVFYGGEAIVQDPADAMVPTMPEAALKMSETKNILSSQEIIDYIVKLNT